MDPLLLLTASPSSGVPIYRQLIDQLCALIASGRLEAGAFLPSVRQVAQHLQVNPMTVSKAYSLLERDGVVELVRGQGMRVKAPDAASTSTAQRKESIQPLLRQVAAQAYQLSLTPEQVLSMLEKLMKEQGR